MPESEDHAFRLANMEKNIERILVILNGNGKLGIVTKLELHEEKINNIPTPRVLKFYALMSGGTVGFISFIAYLIIQACKIASGA